MILNPLRTKFLTLALFVLCALPYQARAEMIDLPVVKLQSLDKTTARTMTFEARVGSTVKFGPLYIKVQSCRKSPPIEQPESAAFLQVWEVGVDEEANWVFSGWMFASSPALSAMDHPIYDVWVIDCLEHKTGDNPAPKEDAGSSSAEDSENEASGDATDTADEAE